MSEIRIDDLRPRMFQPSVLRWPCYVLSEVLTMLADVSGGDALQYFTDQFEELAGIPNRVLLVVIACRLREREQWYQPEEGRMFLADKLLMLRGPGEASQAYPLRSLDESKEVLVPCAFVERLFLIPHPWRNLEGFSWLAWKCHDGMFEASKRS